MNLTLDEAAPGMASAAAAAMPKSAQPSQDFRTYTIGEMARDFEVTFRALRFYESRGLLRPRRVGPHRFYTAADRARLRAILKGKQLGFTLAEISKMTDAAPAAETDHGLKLKLRQVTAQIRHLEEQRRHIDQAIEELRDAERRLSMS